MRMTRTPLLLLLAALTTAGLLTMATRPEAVLGLEAKVSELPEWSETDLGPLSDNSRAAGHDARIGNALHQNAPAQEDPYVVHELSSLAMLRDQFNHDFGRPRLILFLSPT
jgi:hypothetical protein